MFNGRVAVGRVFKATVPQKKKGVNGQIAFKSADFMQTGFFSIYYAPPAFVWLAHPVQRCMKDTHAIIGSPEHGAHPIPSWAACLKLPGASAASAQLEVHLSNGEEAFWLAQSALKQRLDAASAELAGPLCT